MMFSLQWSFEGLWRSGAAHLKSGFLPITYNNRNPDLKALETTFKTQRCQNIIEISYSPSPHHMNTTVLYPPPSFQGEPFFPTARAHRGVFSLDT